MGEREELWYNQHVTNIIWQDIVMMLSAHEHT